MPLPNILGGIGYFHPFKEINKNSSGFVDILMNRVYYTKTAESRRSQVTMAASATGLALGSISTFFTNQKKDRGEGLPWQYWLKWWVSGDIDDQILVSQMAKRGPQNDYAELRPLPSQAATLLSLGCVLAGTDLI